MCQRVYEKGEKQLRVIKLFARLCETEVGPDHQSARRGARGQPAHRATLRRHPARQRRHRRRGDRRSLADRQGQPAARRCSSTTTRPRCCWWRCACSSRCAPSRIPALVGALAHLSRALSVPVVSEYLRRTLAAAERRPADTERLKVERTVIDGFVTHREIEVRYVDAKGNETRRDLRPYFIQPTAEGRHIYVFARDSRVPRGSLVPARPDPVGAPAADDVLGPGRLRHRHGARCLVGDLAGRRRRPGGAAFLTRGASVGRRDAHGPPVPDGPTCPAAGSRCGSTSPARWRCAHGCCAGAPTSRCSNRRRCAATWRRLMPRPRHCMRRVPRNGVKPERAWTRRSPSPTTSGVSA